MACRKVSYSYGWRTRTDDAFAPFFLLDRPASLFGPPPMGSVPQVRIRTLNTAALRPGGTWVVYWMVAQRRTRSNFALDRAIELALELDRPLLVLEALRCDYPWASARMHSFVIDGMADNARTFAKSGALYWPYVEPGHGAGAGLVERLARDAAAVVTDDWPALFIPRMTTQLAERVDVRVEAVDSNGIFPLRATDRAFARAYDFRRFLQKELRPHLDKVPRTAPLRSKLRPCRSLPRDVSDRWPSIAKALAAGDRRWVAQLPIDHAVGPVEYSGGADAGARALNAFASERLERYGEERNHPDKDTASGLSPWLHFGHVSAHDVFATVTSREGWSPEALGQKASGKRSGWWGLSPSAEGFLDQLITWRELGFNGSSQQVDFDRYTSLPDWARATLAEHAGDRRPQLYSHDEFEHAATDDPIWNAAQHQLRSEGRIHNYLRMLWGKKILHWSKSPESALATMIELNDKYAVDGRDPNSYSGIFWVLGRYDRAWGPEREVFGKIRYMSSDNTRRKLRLNAYLERWSDEAVR